MAVMYSCDRCGFKTVEAGKVVRYLLEISTDQPVQSCEVDLCDKCIETAWHVIRDQLFKADRKSA